MELDVGPGHFVPAQPLYNIHDVIQLLCDDFEQYAIESNGVAQCEINKISGLPYWSHTGLKCVPRIHGKLSSSYHWPEIGFEPGTDLRGRDAESLSFWVEFDSEFTNIPD